MKKEVYMGKYVLFLILFIFSGCVEKLTLIDFGKAVFLGVVCGICWEFAKLCVKGKPLKGNVIVIAILLGLYFAYFNYHVFPQSSTLVSLYGGFLVSEIISDLLSSKQQ
ncbi:TPA: hypothetical protein ACFP30_000370 [Neisseria oralis]